MLDYPKNTYHATNETTGHIFIADTIKELSRTLDVNPATLYRNRVGNTIIYNDYEITVYKTKELYSIES